MTLRIHRLGAPGAIVFVLSGVLDAEHAERLQEMLADETEGRTVLDLAEVTLVDRTAVRLLGRDEVAGAEIMHCPEYVRRWMAAESGDR